MRNLLKAFALSLPFCGSALAADLPQPIKPAYVPCSPTACSGFFGGFNITGTGSGLDVLGSGVFAGGGGIGAGGGYQYWDSKIYFAGEVFGDYMFQNFATGAAPGAAPGYLFGEFVDLGVPLGAIFGATPTIPNNGSIASSILASTLSPYVKLGAMERPWGTAWATGAGIAFDISARWFAKLDYIHAVYNNASVNLSTTQQTDNLVRFSLNYKF